MVSTLLLPSVPSLFIGLVLLTLETYSRPRATDMDAMVECIQLCTWH